MSTQTTSTVRYRSVLALCLLPWLAILSACGGGGGGGNGGTTPPGAPTLTLDFGIKQLLFSWPTVSEATHYKLFENPDGVSGFTQVGGDLTSTNTTLDIAVHRHDWPNARYLVEACNSGACTGSNEVATLGEVLKAIGYVKASNTGRVDQFGRSLALSSDGSTLAVGAPSEDSDATGIDGDQANDDAQSAGAVYVFTRDGTGAWSQQAYVKASNTGTNDFFGASLALSSDGNTLAVGAFGEASDATGIGGDETNNDAGATAGAVYVFNREVATWSQQAYVKASNTRGNDRFGETLAISSDGNTLAVGAEGEDSTATGINGDEGDDTTSSAGAAYVYTRDNLGAWTQQAYVKASTTRENNRFGGSLAISADGNTLAVGADGEDSNATGIGGDESDISASLAGAAYVFTRNGTTWDQQAYVKASNTGAGDFFGVTLALGTDGNTLAVGATSEASDATGIDGDQMNNDAPSAGAVYVYTRDGTGTWSQQAYVKASNTEAFDRFGTLALSGDGNTLAVGATGETSNATGIDGDQTNNDAPGAGAAYVYTRDGTGAWSQEAYVKASNTRLSEYQFGVSLALSSNGDTLAVGANDESSSATGIGGDASDNSALAAGAAYLY